MHTTFARAALLLLSVGLPYDVGAQSTTDTLHRDSAAQAMTAPAAAPATSTSSGMGSMPTSVRGYQKTDSVSLGNISDGVQYIYTRNKNDQINVFASRRIKHRTNWACKDDTTTFVMNDVDQYYNTIYLQARQGTVLYDFHLLRRNEDDLHTHGHNVLGGSVRLTYHRRGVPRELFTYYATYALPGNSVRVRVEIPPSLKPMNRSSHSPKSSSPI